MDSPTIAISVSPNPTKGKGGKDQDNLPDDKAFSISLEVAREQADGETNSTNITIGSTPAGQTGANDGTADDSAFSIALELSQEESNGELDTTSITIQGTTTPGTGGEDGDVTIEIETVVFSGEDLALNLSASTVVGGGVVAQTANGAFGVNGSVSGSNDLRLEVGETLTFALPPSEGEVVGGQVTITNLFSNGSQREGALVFAYDTDDQQLACYCAIGNDTGTVTVDIDVPFARLDFKALDDSSWFLQDKSNFGVSDVSVMMASVTGNVQESAGEVIEDLFSEGGKFHDPRFIDFGHAGTVNFEINRISVNKRATLDTLSTVDADLEQESDPRRSVITRTDAVDRSDHAIDQPGWQNIDRFAV